MGSETAESAKRMAGRGWRFVGTGLTLALLSLLGQMLYQRWQELPVEMHTPGWGRAGVALALLLVSSASTALQWRRTLRALGHRLSVVDALCIHFFSQVGKYLPGRVLLVVGKVMLATRQGLPVQAVTASVLYEQALFLMSGALSALVFTGLASADVIGRHRPIILALCLAGFALLHPAAMGQIFRGVRWASRSELAVPALSYGATLRLLVGYCLPWFLSSFAFCVFVTSLAPLELRAFPDMAAAIVLSTILGLVSLFAPAGLGVREAALTALLSVYFSLPVSAAIALGFRLATTLADSVALVVAIALRPQRRWRAAAEAATMDQVPHSETHSCSPPAKKD